MAPCKLPFKQKLVCLDVTMKLFQIRVSLVIESILDPAFYFKGRVVYVKQQNSYFRPCVLNEGGLLVQKLVRYVFCCHIVHVLSS